MYDNKKQDSPNLFHGLEVWAEPAMAAEDLLVNDRGNGQARRKKCVRFFQILLLKSFPHRRLFYFDGCAIAQMHNAQLQLTRRSFIGLWVRARLLGSCLLHMEARYAKRAICSISIAQAPRLLLHKKCFKMLLICMIHHRYGSSGERESRPKASFA